jgi:hypothetical protein
MPPSPRSGQFCFGEPESPKVILLAKSEIRTIYVWQPVEQAVFQHPGNRENDFASSIKSDEEPDRPMAPRAHSSRMTVISRTTRFSSSAPLSPVDPHRVVQGWSSPADLLAYLHSCLRPPWPLIRRAGNTARGPLPCPCG